MENEKFENNEVNEQNNPFSESSSEDEQKSETVEETVQEEESELDKLTQELDTVKNQYIRLAADFDNYRKRQAQERESLLKYGAEETIKNLLPVVDTFDRAKESIKDMNDPEQIKESFEVIYKQFFEALNKVGVKKIETKDVQFDPNLHEAVMQTPTSEYPDHTIIEELQSGYMLNDRVIRAALVNVAVSE